MNALSCLFLLALPLVSFGAEDKVDLAVVHRIKTEAFKSSHVMDHLFQLTDVNGPRLTGSPGFHSAAEWTEQEMSAWGLENAHLEPWAPLEAMRILKTFQLKMDRTVRVALWSGEEQGLCGSRAYVREHFGEALTMTLKPEQARLAVYFNVDNGSGKIRGIHLQDNDIARPIFESWLGPFKDLGADTVTIRDTGGTDHLSFDAVGLPAFQFIQDPLDYGSRTHHSDLDVYDHVEPGDLMQAAAIVASFAYNAATRTEMIPRKPLPKAPPPRPAQEHVNISQHTHDAVPADGGR